jgi:hypothetical protein
MSHFAYNSKAEHNQETIYVKSNIEEADTMAQETCVEYVASSWNFKAIVPRTISDRMYLAHDMKNYQWNSLGVFTQTQDVNQQVKQTGLHMQILLTRDTI